MGVHLPVGQSVSLYSNPRHEVTVTPRIRGFDADGNETWVDGPAFSFRCNVQPVSEQRATELGQQSQSVYRLSCRSWTGGPHFSVEWNGIVMDSLANPKLFDSSDATAHDVVFALARGAHG